MCLADREIGATRSRADMVEMSGAAARRGPSETDTGEREGERGVAVWGCFSMTGTLFTFSPYPLPLIHSCAALSALLFQEAPGDTIWSVLGPAIKTPCQTFT